MTAPEHSDEPPMARAVLAEAVGTFALVFGGCGAIVVDAQSGALGHVGVALSFGLVIAVMVCAVGHLSGAHFNPAVTLAFASLGKFPWKRVPAYWGAQILAAAVAAFLISILIGSEASLGATLPSVSVGRAVGLEVGLTALLMFVITAVATDSGAAGNVAGFAIGGTVALCALFAGPLTGASMNPARSIGPALVSGELDALWLYVVAPMLGACLGAWMYRFCRVDAAQPSV